jgi:cytidyltransferase-like protein
MNTQYDVGIVSGYFNPLHFGHIEYINSAKLQCNELVCIVNNDNQVKIKGSKTFMGEIHRANIMHSIKGVDFSLISKDFDGAQCDTIRFIRGIWPTATMAFFNSGDRTAETIESSELTVCKELNIDYVILDQPKIYSSSELLKQL